MVRYLWDGEMDCGWMELESKVVENSIRFKDEMLEIVSYSPNSETRELINEETMWRFADLARTLSEDLEMGYYYQHEDLENKNDNAYKLNSWILLGSLTECALQIFLAFYIDDYRRSKWQQWEDLDTESVKNPIINTINDMVQKGTITSAQGKTLKKTIRDKIKEHTVEHPVQRIMLDEIIQYYSTMELMNKDEIDYLKKIQSNRNGIHSFKDRTIGTWNDLQHCVRFWCYLLEWILHQLPDVTSCF